MAFTQESAEELLRQARELYQGQVTTRGDLERIQALLDQLVENYPTSDLAVSILLKDEIEGLDLKKIERDLAADVSNPSSEVSESVEAEAEESRHPGLVACLEAKLDDQVLKPMTLSVSLDASGAVMGIPRLEIPVSPDAETRGAFFQVVSALDQCAPFPPEFADQRVVAIVDDTGAILVQPNNVQIDAPSVDSQAQASTEPLGGTASISTNAGDIQPLPSISTVPPKPADEDTEAALGLQKSGIRDLQARLLVLGYDPNGIDGLLGSGTRGALGAWQEANGVERTGYLGADQLTMLMLQSEGDLAVWLEKPGNAALYDPPVLAIGPANISGSWRFTSNCGSNSKLGRMKITGVMTMAHVGSNRYQGRARQSQGFNGRVSGRLQGRQIFGEINWGLLIGRVQFNGTVADEALIIQGVDSNRCSFDARKS